MFPKQRSSVRLSVRALNRFETALIQRLIALSGSEQMSTSPANPPGYGPPPSTLPKSLHRLSEQLITIARQQSRSYRRPGVGKTTLVNPDLSFPPLARASLS